MRIEGKSWQAIADALEYYDRSTACKAVRNLNNRVEMETVEEFREMQSARYESLYEKAIKEIDTASDKGQLVGKSQLLTAARGILDSQTKLLGLAVTQRVELGGEVKVGNKDLDRAIEGFLDMLGGAANPQVAPEEPQVDDLDPARWDPRVSGSKLTGVVEDGMYRGPEGEWSIPGGGGEALCLVGDEDHGGCVLPADHEGPHYSDSDETWT